jgi:hypothetical protein
MGERHFRAVASQIIVVIYFGAVVKLLQYAVLLETIISAKAANLALEAAIESRSIYVLGLTF